MESSNPYAAPAADVRDVAAPADNMVPAGRLRRLGAAILDSVILALLIFVPAGFIAGFSVVRQGGAFDVMNMPPAAGAAVVLGVLVWGGITWYLVHRNGQTIGKKMLDIKVVRTDGSRATVGRIFWVRNVPFWIAGAAPWFNLGTIFSLVDALLIFRASHQCLHDQVADTIVVDA
jgi:uncharacterized RDD family membrane protein YckC